MKETHYSLRTSLTALLLCFVMLVGTTFAWFTDEVTSANNIIKTGKLDIGMKWSADYTTWNESEGADAQPIFKYDLWEPGYTQVRYIKVQNLGSLSFKYQLFINPINETGDLAKVIDVSYAVITDANYSHVNDRALLNSLTPLGTLDKLIGTSEAVAGGVLLPSNVAKDGYISGEVVVCVAFHMQETAGNEYQDKTVGGEFGLNLYATQFDIESDSFDDQYDKDSLWPDKDTEVNTPFSIPEDKVINGYLTEEMTIYSDISGIYAVLPKGVKFDKFEDLNFVIKANADSPLTDDAGSSLLAKDVHIDGVAEDNTVPMMVYLGAILPTGLDATSLKLYHESTQMTWVESVDKFGTPDQFVYDPATGNVVVNVTHFSIFSAVQTSADKWDGSYDFDWYNTNDTTFTLTTAEQLAGFRAIVDGGYYDAEWNWIAVNQDSFNGKIVNLGADIDLDDKPFDPIGFTYAHKGGQVFMGTFDGGNHTIYNLCQNCWELDPDKTKYSTYTYSTAGAGLFASIKNATIKNLVMDQAEIVFECVDMGIVVGYAQGTCHFENIVVTNSNIANHNRYTGGVVGEVCFGEYGVDPNLGISHTFTNIVVDSTVTISGLWGSFGGGFGGIIGGKWGDATVYMENVISAPVMDVHNDVVSAYQWYAFRGCGMLIGHTEQSSPKKATDAAADFLTCKNVDVYYGDWVEYHYYQFPEQKDKDGNELWYSNYPWVRAEVGRYYSGFSNIRYGHPIVDGVVIDTPELAEKHKTSTVKIVFEQLYGGDQGVYGCATHEGVKVHDNSETKTIYFQNNWKWTELKIYYWYAHGDDTWTTCPEGIVLTDKSTQQVGGSDLYTFEIPAYVAGFKIEGYDKDYAENNGIHSTREVYAEDIVGGKIYWFVFANNEYSLAASEYTNGSFKTHDIYLVGEINQWTISNNWHLTESADGMTWTGTFTIDATSNVKLYNAKILHDQAAYIAQKDILNNEDTRLAPGKYTFTYSVADNNFTFKMTERKIYLKPGEWSADKAWFQAWTWGGGIADSWITFTDSDKDGVYEAFIPVGRTGMKLVRKSPSHAENTWDKWNETGDINIPSDGKNLFTITYWSGGDWSTK